MKSPSLTLGKRILLLVGIPGIIGAFSHLTHKNIPEDAFLFMESRGSIQMRWVTDYLKAKAGGRYSGACATLQSLDPKDTEANCGAIGMVRAGGVSPDYHIDNFWDFFLGFDWKVETYGFFRNNFTSMQHFINLTTQNSEGYRVVTDVYNDYDGYGYNAAYGSFKLATLDTLMALGLNSAQMTIDLPNCTHSKCAEKWSPYPNANTPIDYRQNGSKTPVGTPSSDSKKLATSDGSNYNCYSDTFSPWPLELNCPDEGTKVNGDEYQIPNTIPGGGDRLTGDQDWIIYEPGDNAATFYYVELFLEGGSARNGQLDTSAIVGRYYTLAGGEIYYLGIPNHWSGDNGQQTHIWSSLGFNHGDYESWVEERYGLDRPRSKGECGVPDPNTNFECFDQAESYLAYRQNRYNLDREQDGQVEIGYVDYILMEQAFLTYYVRFRAGYDTLTDTSDATRKRAATYAINTVIGTIALELEKGVMDLRRCRNSSSCDNQ